MARGDRKTCPNYYHPGPGRRPKKPCRNYSGMKRLYERHVIPGKGQQFVPVGWHCESCGKTLYDDKRTLEKRLYPGASD
jgi:hypothetical protein